jgi:hypothetical protein
VADDYADENVVSDEVLQPPHGRPRANHPHAHDAINDRWYVMMIILLN